MPVEEVVIDDQQVEPIEGQQGEEQQVTEEVQQQIEPVVAQDTRDERTIPKWIREMKTSRPNDFVAAKDNFFAQKATDEWLKTVGGREAVDKALAYLNENGGLDGLTESRQSLQEKAEELDGLLSAAQNGEASIADRLFEVAGPKASDIGRAFVSQWSSKDPEGWNDAITPIFAATILQGQAVGLDGKTAMSVPDMLTEAKYASQFASTPEQKAEIAQNALNSLTSFLAGFTNKQPNATPAPNKQKMSALDERERGINEREQQQFLGTVSGDLRNGLQKEAEAQLKTYFDRRPDDKDARELATTNVIREVNERLAKDQDFNKKWDALIAKKDKDSALKLAGNRQKAIIGEIAARVGRTIFGNPTAPVVKKAPTPQKPPAQPASNFSSSLNGMDGFDAIFHR